MVRTVSFNCRAVVRGVVLVVVATAALLLGAAPSSRAGSPPQPLTTCSDGVRDGSYYLTGDLDCGGATSGINTHERNATIELRGFTIRNALIAVHCDRCSIIGPGTIADSLAGVDGYVVKLVNVTLRDITSYAVRVLQRLIVEDSEIEDSGTGVFAPKRALIIDSEITGNRKDGIEAFGQSGDDQDACIGGKVILKNTIVTGNNTGPASGSDCQFGAVNGCADIKTCGRPPALKDGSACGTSLSVKTGTSWGVCALD